MADDFHETLRARHAAFKNEATKIPIHNHDLFNHAIEHLIAALDKLDIVKGIRVK